MKFPQFEGSNIPLVRLLIASGAALGVIAGTTALVNGRNASDQDFFVATNAYSAVMDKYPEATNLEFNIHDSPHGTLTFELPNGIHCVSAITKSTVGDKVGEGAYVLMDDLIVKSVPLATCTQ
jgi:hypothetical protein